MELSRTSRALVALMALATAVLIGAPLMAGTLAGVTLPDTAPVGGADLVLNGMALREKMVFDVYVAGLYLPAKQTDAKAVLAADTARRTVLHFVRDVDKAAICDAWTEGLAANTPGASAQLKKDFATLCGWMEDIGKGQQYAFTYEPGKGTEVSVKGAVKGTVAGKEFADALWACWIGAKPGPGEAFKKGLMGG